MSKATSNIFMQSFAWTYVFHSFRQISRNGIAESYVKSMFSFGYPYVKKTKNPNPNVGPIQTLLKWDPSLKYKPKTKQLLEKYISKNGGLTLGKDFLYLTSKK